PQTSVALVSVMAVNNELGTRFDPTAMRPYAGVLHSDITQAAAKYRLDLTDLDYATLSAHKFYGPKGVGALYMRDTALPPMLHGGEHEHGLRAGTLNVAGIVGMGAAAQLARERRAEDSVNIKKLRASLVAELERVTDLLINGGPDVAEHILSLSV